jgi:hypothetical protein
VVVSVFLAGIAVSVSGESISAAVGEPGSPTGGTGVDEDSIFSQPESKIKIIMMTIIILKRTDMEILLGK